ncbi:MAG: nucleoside 2-deoxyribosyltransferase [Acidobacteriota bacterium]|nr:nucleoside 2-deoxyribosyltransferase [Acidobacteriota bacterium]
MNQQCLICKSKVPAYSWNNPEPGARIKCELCGEYRISEPLATNIFSYPLRDSYIYSGAIREHYEQDIILWVEDLKELRDSVVVPKNPLESIDRILLHVLRKIKSADDGVEFKQTDRSIAYARNASEFSYFLWLARELGYLEIHPQGQSRDRLTLNGWKHLADIPQQEISPSQAFVAMWFHKDLEDAWENGLKPALKLTGYDPIRLDRTEYNEKIDDRIVAEIRKSGLLIADFTGQRGSVYFEAGFAMGLGIPVIWTCRDTDINDLHFDTRQYNYIVWKDTTELKERLINRIEATLPNRPKPKLEGLR